MKTALVTGHLGFIGQHLVEALRKLQVEVAGVDLKDGDDICNRHSILPGADVCFHLAAMTDARSYDVENTIRTNVMGTVNVLEQYGNKVVFASSSAVNYPVNAYAISKLAGEQLCRAAGARVLRLCNITGPGGHGVFEKFAEQDVLQVAGMGDQIRTYAPVKHAVATLIGMVLDSDPGELRVLRGDDLKVSEIASKFFPGKPWTRVPRVATDIIDGRQL